MKRPGVRLIRLSLHSLLFTLLLLSLGLKKCPDCGKTYEDTENYCADCVAPGGGPVRLKSHAAVQPASARPKATANRWQRAEGGALFDIAYDVELAVDGGYVVVGQTESFAAAVADTSGGPHRDAWLVKLGSDGRLEWQQPLGGAGEDYGHAVVKAGRSGFLVVGTTSAGIYHDSGLVIRTDAAGNGLWEEAYAASTGRTSWLQDAVAVPEGGFVMAGRASTLVGERYLTAAWLLKLGPDGNPLWEQCITGNGVGARARALAPCTDGGFLLVGYTGEPMPGWSNMSDVHVWRLNSAGSLVWERSFGGSLVDYGRGGCQTSDGGFAVVGRTQSFGDPLGNAWLLRLDSDGEALWSRTFGGIREDHARDIVQTPDGGFAITGFTCSSGGGKADVWLIRTDKDGNHLWTRTYGGKERDEGYALRQAGDGGFIIAGYTESFDEGQGDAWVIKTDANGYAE